MRKLYLFFVMLCTLLGIQTANAWVIYLNPEYDPGTVYCYLTNNQFGGWKGKQMTKICNNLYVVSGTDSQKPSGNSVMFCNSDESYRTTNGSPLTFADGYLYDYNSYKNGGSYGWKLKLGSSEYDMTYNSSASTYTTTITVNGSTTIGLRDTKDDSGWFKLNCGTGTITDSNLSNTVAYGETPTNATLSGTYTVTFTPANKNLTLTKNTPTIPDACYVVGYVNGKSWNCNDGVALTESSDGIFTGTITLAPVEGNGTFCVATELNSDWNTFNSNYRYGPSAGDRTVAQSGEASAMKQGDLAWCVSNSGSYAITVNFNTNTMTLVSNGGTDDPEEPETDYPKVALVNNAGGSVVAYFTQDATKSWLWTLGPQSINTAADNSNDEKYRFRVYTSSTAYVDYSIGSDANNPNYWIDGGITYDLGSTTSGNFCIKSLTSGYFAVSMLNGVLQQGIVSSTDESSKLVDPNTIYDVPTVDLTKVNMPLKEADFANGKKHYFVVGTRMAEWRLQPEWELLDEDGDGTYTLNNRLVYTGKMGIAMVDNYTDYVNQRYSYFYENTYQKSGATFTVNLTKAGDNYTAIQYDNTGTHGQFTTEKTFRFEYTGDLNEDGIRQSTPTLVGAMTLTVETSGVPTKFVMSGISTTAADIAQYRTFSLVGSGIIFDGANWSTATPLQNQSGYTTDDWQESWIQYDELGMPYVDAHGNTIYQTVFQMDWLQNHPTLFRASDGFEYNSVNMVMSYNSARTHATTIPADGETAYWYNGTQNTSSRNGSWQCFELENMWMQGEFKVWTGWGGANKYHDGSNTNLPDARWNYDNGGHEKEGADWSITAADNVYYMTKRDINEADYKLDNRIFARYVRLWWDPSGGFDNSLIQLIVEEGGPQISCARVGKHNLSYTYGIAEDLNDQLKNYYVKNITITRYHVGTDDVVTEAQVSSTDYADGAYAATNLLTQTTVNDDYYAEGGYYWYGIEVTYYPNATAGYSEEFTRDAKSNQVFIYFDTIPTGVTVKQVTENGSNGETLYSFDLAIDGGAPATLVGQTTTSGVDVLSLVKYYVVTVPKYSDTTYNLFTAVDGATELTAAYGSQLNYDFTNNHYFAVAPDAANAYKMPTITLKNVIPGNYTVKVDMVAADGDEAAWAEYNVSTASASVNMVKPATKFSAENFGVERIDGAVTLAAEDESVKPYGSKNAAITYTKANKVVSTDGKFDQLMVTNGVLEDWEVKYYVTLEYVDPTDASTEAKAFKYYSAFNDFNQAVNPVALNSGALTATLEYLPMATTTADVKFNEAIGNLSITQRSATGYEMKASTRVDYTRRDLGAETGSSSAMVSAETMESTATVLPDDNFAAYAPNLENAKRSYQVWGGWDGSNASYYYDAFANLEIAQDDSETLYRVAGFYANTTGRPASIPYHENCTKNDGLGGEAIGGAGYSANYTLDGYDPADATKSHPAAASAAGKLPFAVHYAGVAASADEAMPENIGTMYVVVTADYPIEVKDQPTLSIKTETLARATTTTGFHSVVAESGSNAKSLQMVTYPVETNSSYTGVTTDIEDVVADGDGEIRIYPNPAVDVVTVAGSAALGTVEIYSLDGRLVKVVEAEDYSATIAVGDLAKGTYVVRAGGLTERMIKM